MNIIKTKLPGVIIIEPKIFSDNRGRFWETWNSRRYEDYGIKENFVQDNVSYSGKNVLRGLHYQHPYSQGKLVQVLAGRVWDIAVDIRPDSPTFRQWISAILSDANYTQIYIPPGFAHGFCVLSEFALFSYKCTNYYIPSAEGGIIWNDPDIGIDWPVSEPILSEKDHRYPALKNIPKDKLPSFKP